MSAIRFVGGRLNDLRIGTKLYASFAVVVVALLVAVVVGWSSIASVSQTVKRGYAVAIAANQASAAAYNMHVSQVQNVADGGRVTAMHAQDVAGFTAALSAMGQQLTTPAEHTAARSVAADFAGWSALDKQVSALVAARNTAGAVKLADGIANSSADALSTQLTKLGQLVKSTADGSSSSAQSNAQMLMVVLALISLVIACALAFILARSLSTRAQQMLRAADGIAAGDIEQRIDARSKDELGATAAAFERMIQYLKEMAAVADGIANGDLSTSVAARSDRDALGTSFATMLRNLRDVIGQVTSAAGSVGAASQQMASTSEEAGRATGEIASAISDVAQGAERQVNMLEAARTAAEEVAAAVRDSADQAEQTAEVATRARESAQQGITAAEQANRAMRSVRDSSDHVTGAIRELASKSQQIGEIVQTITAIAEQTNLLALNAAIEAARAGEQGRGFAVVAEEVRKLAEESQHAAHEISELIAAIQAETSKAVDVVEDGAQRTADGAGVVEQTRTAFTSIGEAVEDMVARVEQIAASSEQITASATTMLQNISEVASVAEQSSASSEEVSASTEQTSASTEEIAASAQELAGNAETLRRLVGHFQLSIDADGGSLEETFAAALQAHHAWNARLREAIDTGRSSMPVEQAARDDACAFGKWLHAPGQFREQQPECWQHLHDLHGQFHADAAEILKLATTGSAGEARERMRGNDFAAIERQLSDALTTANV